MFSSGQDAINSPTATRRDVNSHVALIQPLWRYFTALYVYITKSIALLVRRLVRGSGSVLVYLGDITVHPSVFLAYPQIFGKLAIFCSHGLTQVYNIHISEQKTLIFAFYFFQRNHR